MRQKGGVKLKYSKLRGKRAELGISQQQMALKLGISTGAYCLKENGKREFTCEEISTILNILQSKFEDIFITKMSHE